jgi:hypothetical protein
MLEDGNDQNLLNRPHGRQDGASKGSHFDFESSASHSWDAELAGVGAADGNGQATFGFLDGGLLALVLHGTSCHNIYHHN